MIHTPGETLTDIGSTIWEAMTLTTPSAEHRVLCPRCRDAPASPENGGARPHRRSPGVFCEFLRGVGRFRCRTCKRESVVVRPRGLEGPLGSQISEAHRLIRYEDEQTGTPVLDPSYQVWCACCGNVLSTYLFGASLFLCSDCRWVGVVARNSTSFVMSYFTVAPPAPEWRWRTHCNVSWTGPGGLLGGPPRPAKLGVDGR